MRFYILAASMVVILLAAASGEAQTGGKFAVGASMSMKATPAGTVGNNGGVGLLWRFGHSRDGWKLKYGLGWYSTPLEGNSGDTQQNLGDLHIRPLMAGYGYTHRVGRAAFGAHLMAGYSFSSFSLDRSIEDTYRALHGTNAVTSDASNGFVLKPEISSWIDLNEKVGLHFGVGYMIARPELTIRTPTTVIERRSLRADAVIFKVGVVYSIF